MFGADSDWALEEIDHSLHGVLDGRIGMCHDIWESGNKQYIDCLVDKDIRIYEQYRMIGRSFSMNGNEDLSTYSTLLEM